MNYLNPDNNRVVIHITKEKAPNTYYRIQLFDSFSKNTVTVNHLVDESLSDLFYEFQIPSIAEQSAEYIYQLLDNNGEIISAGLIRCGDDPDQTKKQYKTEKQTIIYGK